MEVLLLPVKVNLNCESTGAPVKSEMACVATSSCKLSWKRRSCVRPAACFRSSGRPSERIVNAFEEGSIRTVVPFVRLFGLGHRAVAEFEKAREMIKSRASGIMLEDVRWCYGIIDDEVRITFIV